MKPLSLTQLRSHLHVGQVIPAMPLALDHDGSWSQRYQRALVRYYLESRAGGLAVGVHTTQFEIRDPQHGLFEPLLSFCANEIGSILTNEERQSFALITGVCGTTESALAEAKFAKAQGYDAALLSLTAMREASEAELIEHCRQVGAILPLIGFYLQPSIGGRRYDLSFWRRFVEIESVVAIKIAPFDRYATLDVVRAVAESGRDDIALYTGNDDNIIHDLLTPFPWGEPPLRIVGGLLGQWAVGTRSAVALLESIKSSPQGLHQWAETNAKLTDFNAALFDSAHRFAGCIAGIQEWLRRQGLVPSRVCLHPQEDLSPGQDEEITRVIEAYPEWQDTEFISTNLERWLAD